MRLHSAAENLDDRLECVELIVRLVELGLVVGLQASLPCHTARLEDFVTCSSIAFM